MRREYCITRTFLNPLFRPANRHTIHNTTIYTKTTHTLTHAHTHTHARARAHTHTHAHTYTHPHTHTNTHTHARTHAPTHTQLPSNGHIYTWPSAHFYEENARNSIPQKLIPCLTDKDVDTRYLCNLSLSHYHKYVHGDTQ